MVNELFVFVSVVFVLSFIAIIPAMIFQFRYRWVLCKIVGGLFVVVLAGSYFLQNTSTSSQASGQVSAISQPRPTIIPPPPEPVETKQQYLSSTKKIGNKKTDIFWKEFLKNPDKFRGHRLNATGQIFRIEESEGSTVLQVYITHDYDSIIVTYPGSIPFYKDDEVVIYGEGAGKFEGENAMGATMQWPVVTAKYIEKFKGN